MIISHCIFIAEFEAISEDINQKFDSDAQDSQKKSPSISQSHKKTADLWSFLHSSNQMQLKTESPSELARFFTEKSADSSKAEAFVIL